MTSPETSTTPVRQGRRAPLIVMGVALVVIVLVTVVLRPPSYTRGMVGDPENPDPNGSMAVVEVLRSQGVDVRVVRSVSSALAADSRLLAVSNPSQLTSFQSRALAESAVDIVLIGATRSLPGFPEFATARGAAPPPSECGDPRAAAGPIDSAAPYLTGPDARACLPGPSEGKLLTMERTNGAAVTIIPGDVLHNEHLLEASNAAFALRVLGERPALTWLVGSPGDTYGQEDIGAGAPLDWLWASIAALFLAAIWWRGPRFGKLVAEPLPVIVNASETTIGRGQLYRRSGDFAHSAIALRLGCLQRIAPRIGLAPNASRREVVDKIAAASRTPVSNVDTLLYGPPPRDSRSLHALALALDALENEVEYP